MTGIPQRVKTNEERGVIGRSKYRFPVEYSPIFVFIQFPKNAPGKGSGYRGGTSELGPTHTPLKSTFAFDPSLIPLSAVVKGCVTFGPNVEADE